MTTLGGHTDGRGRILKAIAYGLAFLGMALAPMNCVVACETTGKIDAIAFILFLLASTLSLAVPRGTPHRLRPMAFSFLALVANTLLLH